MQARIIALRQEEEGDGGQAPQAGKPKDTKVSDDVMLAKLAKEGWAEHVTNETEKE